MSYFMNRRKLRYLTFGVFVLAGIAFLGSEIRAYFNSESEKRSNLLADLAAERKGGATIHWLNTNNPGRPISSQTLSDIGSDYNAAWMVRNRSVEWGNSDLLGDYFTDSAQKKIADLIEFNVAHKQTFQEKNLKHLLDLHLYSEDGQLVSFTDVKQVSFRRAFHQQKLLESRLDTTCYKVVMLLEDGFWRVRQLVSMPVKEPTHEVSSPSTPQLSNIKGVNYYPKHAPWDTFGDAFDTNILKKDFKRVKNMGLNSLRVFIQYEDFGKEQVNPQKIQKLQALLNQAESANLQVILTLFDFYGNYDLKDWNYNLQHLREVVGAVKDHPAIHSWDIKNEPDLDFESRGKQNVLDWLKTMIAELRQIDPNTPITIGWSNAKVAHHLSEQCDYVSFHYYKEPQKFTVAFANLQQKVAKPILLQEYGLSTYSGIWNVFGADYSEQKAYYESMQRQLEKLRCGYIFWTLYDFEEVPENVVGSWPWRKKRQQHFGLWNLADEPKWRLRVFN